MTQDSVKGKGPPLKKPPGKAAAPLDETLTEESAPSAKKTTPPQDQTEALVMDPGTGPESKAGQETEFHEATQKAEERAEDKAQTSPKSKPADTQKAATNLGDYKLVKKLGQGGMGAVYKAHQISLDREVAVKVLSKELAAKGSFVRRFMREARVMAMMDHPNILRCYEVKEAMGYHYLSMEYVEGGSVEGWFKKLGKFAVGDALHILLAAAAGLQHAHELGLVHRDVKPDNILLTKKGVVKVADLGLAKATDDDMGLTKTGTGAGTPIYMAPEQARDVKHVDGRVDIYALGVMTYVFLTGQAPFKGETLVELIEAKERGKFEPIRKFNDETPERLELIVGKMMARKPEHRYASCAEVIAEIQALGLANACLSFFGGDAAPLTGLPGVHPTSKPSGFGVATGGPKSDPPPMTLPSMLIEPEAPQFWFWKFVNDNGKRVTKKLTYDQVVTLIKDKTIDPDAQVSKEQKDGYRALGSYNEFKGLALGIVAQQRADRKTEKFKEMYKKIEEEEQSRQDSRWYQNLRLKAGGMAGYLLWLAIIAAILVGAFFLIKWGFTFLGEQINKATTT